MSKDKSHRANASQFFVAGELCRRGFVAVPTLSNTPTTDILCSNKKGNKFVHLQVKTFRLGGRTCSVGVKAETNGGKNFFWILTGMSEKDESLEVVFYIIPAPIISRHVRREFKIWKSTPGKRNQQRDVNNRIRTIKLTSTDGSDWIKEYEGKWELLEKALK